MQRTNVPFIIKYPLSLEVYTIMLYNLSVVEKLPIYCIRLNPPGRGGVIREIEGKEVCSNKECDDLSCERNTKSITIKTDSVYEEKEEPTHG